MLKVRRRCGGSLVVSMLLARHAHAAQAPQLLGDLVDDPAFARPQGVDDRLRHLRRRDEQPPLLLWQPADQRRHELLAQRRHEPIEADIAHRAKRHERDVDGHAVVGRARLETIREP